jgi:Putative outer membrane beta-barrel porin, MtrB/PioB
VLPYGGSWGHSSLVEIPAPIDFRTTDFETNGEFSHGPLLARASFSGSWFNNANTEVTFDNPFRLTDAPSTPARGRSSLAPSNSFLQVNGMASVRFAGRSRATAYVSTGSLKDVGDLLMPQTINTSITGLVTPLPRTTVEGAARTNAVNLTFVSHPSRWFDVDARYRLYDYDNRTPDFVMPQRVSYDNTPAAPTYSTLGGATSTLVVETEPFGVKRHTFDATVRVPAGTGTAGAGYSFLGEDRTHRFFESTSENVLRLSYDLVGTGLVTVRSKYEHGAKRGDVTEESQRELFGIGEQPEMRHFDIASRDRDRVTILASAAPAVGKDDYIESSFGLRDNTHRIYSGGTEWVPSERVSLGGSYSYERYVALLHSRQASPPAANAAISYETFVQLSSQPSSTVQVADATRNWGSDGTDRVHSLIVHADLLKLAEKWDVHINYDFNHAQSLYTYTTGPNVPRTLPEDVPPPTSSLPDPSQLPLVRSELQRGSADLIYALTSRLGIGVSYWYEQYRVQDFTLDADANQDLVRAGPVLLLGYMYRPYTANTVLARMIYRW